MALATKEYYSKGESDFSVTEIISSPRIRNLRVKHDDQIEVDVSSMVWSLLGQAIHAVLERSGDVEGHTKEERLYAELDGVILSGAVDLQYESDGEIDITDFKFTSAWALKKDKFEWEAQLNIYAWLVACAKGKRVRSLKICAIVRDWSNRIAATSENYPAAPIQMIQIPLWTMAATEAYIRERLNIHRNNKVTADWSEELDPCSDDERWLRETSYAVKKVGGKRAMKVFQIFDEAAKFQAETKGTEIEVRKGEAVRCTGNYCNVAPWCTQYQAELAAKTEAQTEV